MDINIDKVSGYLQTEMTVRKTNPLLVAMYDKVFIEHCSCRIEREVSREFLVEM